VLRGTAAQASSTAGDAAEDAVCGDTPDIIRGGLWFTAFACVAAWRCVWVFAMCRVLGCLARWLSDLDRARSSAEGAGGAACAAAEPDLQPPLAG